MISNTSPQEVIFNSSPSIELMVVTFQDGNMILYETWNQRAVKTAQQDCHYMACSPDGRTLVTGSSWGVLGLWDFETLTLLYQINTRETLGKALSFTACGTRIIELRDRKTKVWEPAALIRRVTGKDSGISEPVTLPVVTVGEGEEDIVPITSACLHPTHDAILVGKDDGSMNIYSALSGEWQYIIYNHRQDIFVRKIATSASNVVASEDASNTVLVYEVHIDEQSGLLAVSSQLLSHRFDAPVQQLVLNSGGDRLIVSTTTCDYLWSRVSEAQFIQIKSLEASPRSIWKWMSSIRVPGTVLLVVDMFVRSFSWDNLEERSITPPTRKIDVGPTNLGESDLGLKALATDGTYMIAEFAHRLGSKGTERLAVWRADAIESQDEGSSTEPCLTLSSKEVKHFLGIFQRSIVFLDHHLWVCSIDVTTLRSGCRGAVQEMVKKHFFIPLEFMGGNEGNTASVSSKGNVIFPKEEEIAVVRDGLKWSL